MKKFEAPQWESDATGDEACRALFSQSNVKPGKSKKKRKKKKIEIIENKQGINATPKKNRKKNPILENTQESQVRGKKKLKKIQASDLKAGYENFDQDNNKPKKMKKKRDKPKIVKEEEEEDEAELRKDVQKMLEEFKTQQNESASGGNKRKLQEKEESNSFHSKKVKLKKDREQDAPISNKKSNAKASDFTGDAVKLNRKQRQNLSLRDRMMEKLKAARFRYINQQIYTATGGEIKKFFEKDKQAFQEYHTGYRQQVNRWDLNPLDVIINSIKKMPKDYRIADFGCGDAKLAKSVEQPVHSFDLFALNEMVTTCDMSKVPLENECVDVAVFCLSLMGTNLQDYILEANRVLKIEGLLKIAEVESRFDSIDEFVKAIERYGFVKVRKDSSKNLFYFLDFKKQSTVKNRKKLPVLSLKPCLYKKR